MKTIDTETLVTATGGNHCMPRGFVPAYGPYYGAPMAPRWAYAPAYMPAYAPRVWAGPRGWWY